MESIKKIEAAEIVEVARLHAQCFDNAKSPAYLRWKYYENPAGEGICLAAYDGADIIASSVMIPEEFHIRGEKSIIYKCCDLMVAPAYRKRGLAKKLVAALGEYLVRQGGAYGGYTLCGKNATPSFLKNNWVSAGGVHIYFKLCRFLKARFFYRKIERMFKEGIIRDVGSLEELGADYGFNPGDAGFSHFRSRRYLEWRLTDPCHKYRILSYDSGGGAKGYLIYNDPAADNAACIMAMWADKGERRVLSSLIEAFELSCYRAGRGLIIAIAVKESIFSKILTENGYRRNPFKRGPLASSLDFNVLYGGKIGALEASGERWDICSLNYDDI